MNSEVLVVGAGLAGLCCARELHRRGIPFRILDASDGVGGRIRTDFVDGFRLDRGFQVFLTSYPEAQKHLDYPSLGLRPFLPGAMVRVGGQFHSLTDPWRRPIAAICSLFGPVGTFSDKLRIARLRSKALRGSLEDRFRDPETTTQEALKTDGFSDAIIGHFFRPFLGGIFLESDLSTSSRMFRFVFRMFSQGEACLPAEGMEAIPRQLASGLPPDRIRLGVRVSEVKADSVRLDSGEIVPARAVVVATDGASAAGLLGGDIPVASQGVSCLYFAAPRPPLDEPVLVLDGEGRGPVNNLCVPTAVAPTYGPPGASLVSATVLGTPPDEQRLRAEVRDQLAGWFGTAVDDWRHLRTYRIPYALPQQLPPALAVPERPVRWKAGIYLCGDHRDNASINGAMVSGRRAAEAIADDIA